jgi:hypothetical protein
VRPVVITIALLALGAALIVPFEAPVTRVLGVLALFAAIAYGTYGLVTPAALEREDDD